MASFTKEVNLRLAKRPLKTNGCLANRSLTSLVKETTDPHSSNELILLFLPVFSVARGVGEMDLNRAPTPIAEGTCHVCPYLLLDVRDGDEYNDGHITTGER